jgi:predicted short-subunit dehydrogenase-like oxidoreductase (DUF2520 family)
VEDRFDGKLPNAFLGGLPNVAVHLDPEKRALYHSLVSVAGNFPAMLWVDVFSRFESDLGLPRELLAPFLFRSLGNVLSGGHSALTGPMIRGDSETVRRHREVLSGTALSPIYDAFEKFYSENFTHPSRIEGVDHV